jgi:acyl carrier protein
VADFDPRLLAESLREDSMFHDADVLVDSQSGIISALVVPQGFRPAPQLRQRAMRLAGDVADRIELLLLHDIPRGPDGSADPERARAAGVVCRYEPAATDIEQSVIDLVVEVLPGRQVSITDSIIELGGDSLVTLELATLIGERLGVDIAARDVFGAESLRHLAATLSGHLADRPARGQRSRDGGT